MTRGQIVLITENGVLTSTEFNGDMYYDGYGKSVIEALGKVHTEQDYIEFVKKFNAKNFEYDEDFIYNACKVDIFENGERKPKTISEEELFDFSKDYFDKWFSDYLYIKNLRSAEVKMTDNNGLGLAVASGGLVMLNFGAYTEKCSEHSECVKITLSEKVIEICETHGWTVNYCADDDCVELEKYSPEGEDFGFTVSASNFIKDVKQYAEDFDPDEHAEMWIEGRGKRGVPSSIRDLIDDADAIDAMLQELATAIEKIGENR